MRHVRLRYGRDVLSPAQVQRLQACARVLDPPARVVMTGNVATSAVEAIRAGAREGVEVLIVEPGAVARVDGSIDVLFIGPAAPFSVAAELFGRWPCGSRRAGCCSCTARSPRRR